MLAMDETNWEYGDVIVKERGGDVFVAVVGACDDWKAYHGPLMWGWAAVKAGGDLVSERDADALFPEMSGLHYRS